MPTLSSGLFCSRRENGQIQTKPKITRSGETMQTIAPAPRTLFCKPDEAKNETHSGILLATQAEKPKTATVINVGEGVTYQRDDIIIYKPYATTEVKLDGQEYILVSEEDIIGKLVEND